MKVTANLKIEFGRVALSTVSTSREILYSSFCYFLRLNIFTYRCHINHPVFLSCVPVPTKKICIYSR